MFIFALNNESFPHDLLRQLVKKFGELYFSHSRSQYWMRPQGFLMVEQW